MVIGAICTAVVVFIASGAYAVKVFITNIIEIEDAPVLEYDCTTEDEDDYDD